MNIKSSPVVTAIVTIIVCVIASFVIIGFSQFAWLIAGVVFVMGLGEIGIIYLMKRAIIARKQNIFAQVSIVLIGLTLITCVADLKFGSYVMPGWTSVLGILLFFSGNYLMMTALFALPRHGKEEYGENEKADKTALSVHGPYDIIRHPINLAGFLIAIAIPLMLGSAYGFIPAFLASVFIIVQAVTIENYRFEHYKWYYDYTKKVPYMMIPVIW